jgi:hypothetical protein
MRSRRIRADDRDRGDLVIDGSVRVDTPLLSSRAA